MFDRLAWQRDYRKKNGDIHTKNYEKTISGKLMRTYKNMYHRIKGIISRGKYRYEGLDILSKEEFYSWSKSDYEDGEYGVRKFWGPKEATRFDTLESLVESIYTMAVRNHLKDIENNLTFNSVKVTT